MQRGDGEMEGGGDEDGTKGEEWKEIGQCLYVRPCHLIRKERLRGSDDM